jgi:DNA-binding GntR family transcriptional regulator
VSITDSIRMAILGGEFAPGVRLVELQLAEHYGASRASVRGAISELEKEGLVDREANRGATVRRVSIDEALQITEVRGLLEGLAAARAAAVATAADHEELCSIIESMRDAVTTERFVVYSELNGLLHRRLREISGHAVACDLIENLRNRAASHEFRLALMPGRPAESLRQHEAIVDAVIAGDGPAAEAAMHTHLRSVMDVLRRWSEAGFTA